MPIYEFCCLECGEVFETLQRLGDSPPVCPLCQSGRVEKLISAPGAVIDRGASVRQRETSILRRAGEYLRDGKVAEARRFLKEAQEHVRTDSIKRLSDRLQQQPRGGYLVSKPAAVITKKKS